MIHCRDFSQGYLTYHCEHCDKIVNTGLSCNSRFCPSCGNRYRDERTLSISKKVIAKTHRQFVFSMAYDLRRYFAVHEDDLLDEDDPNRKGRQYVTESVFKFMKKLCRHIPNKGFHNIRYYGFYSKRSINDISSLGSLYTKNELNKMKQNINWNKKMKLTYNYEPLMCTCGHMMKFCPELSYFPPPKGPKQLSIDDYDENGDLYA